jgi:hypothetical protein
MRFIRQIPREEWDLLLRVAGVLVSGALGAATSVVEVLWCPMYVSGFRFPLSLILALVLNPVLVWFAHSSTKWKAATLAPALTWCIVWFAASMPTGEGDLLITQSNWVGLVTTLLGPTAFGAAIYRLVLSSMVPQNQQVSLRKEQPQDRSLPQNPTQGADQKLGEHGSGKCPKGKSRRVRP